MADPETDFTIEGKKTALENTICNGGIFTKSKKNNHSRGKS